MNVTLTGADRRTLRRLADGPADAEELAATDERSADELADRLAELADNDLVRAVDGGYELADSGRRALAAPGDGTADGEIDLPESAVREMEALELRPDREDAVVDAVAFLRTEGAADGALVRDALYGERPAGYDDADAWWRDCVEPALASLSVVRRDADGGYRYVDPGAQNEGSTSSS